MKKYSYIAAGIDFVGTFIYIYLGFTRNIPLSFFIAGFCLIVGILEIIDK